MVAKTKGKSVDEDVLQILRSMECEGDVARLTCGTLDRKVYERVNKVLAAVGGNWNRGKGGHVFDRPAAEALASVLGKGTYRNQKQEDGFFETPVELAEQVAELADIRPGMHVLEPSAGRGRLVRQAVKCGGVVMAVELDERHRGSLEEAGASPVIIGDFLEQFPKSGAMYAHHPRFDRALMNPPFGQRGSQLDIDHVMRAWWYLRRSKGWRLVAIMSSGWTFRQNARSQQFRELVDEYGFYEKLPEGTFKESGTMVHAVIVVLQK